MDQNNCRKPGLPTGKGCYLEKATAEKLYLTGKRACNDYYS
jgi:hypothetical protein